MRCLLAFFWGGGLGFREFRVPEGIYEVVFFSPFFGGLGFRA